MMPLLLIKQPASEKESFYVQSNKTRRQVSAPLTASIASHAGVVNEFRSSVCRLAVGRRSQCFASVIYRADREGPESRGHRRRWSHVRFRRRRIETDAGRYRVRHRHGYRRRKFSGMAVSRLDGYARTPDARTEPPSRVSFSE